MSIHSILRVLPAVIVGIIYFFSKRYVLLEVTLDMDEIISWMAITGKWSDFFLNILNDSQQFLYYALIKIWESLVPVDNDYWLRLPSLIFISAGIGLVFYILKEIYSGLVAALAIVFLVFNPVFGYYAAYHRPYSLLVLLGAFNIYLVWKMLKTEMRSERVINLFLVNLVLILYTHYLGMIYVGAILAALFILKIHIPLSKKRMIALLSVGVLYFGQLCYQFFHSLQLISWTKSRGTFWHLDKIYLIKNPMDAPLSIATYICVFLFLLVLVFKRLRKDIPLDKFVLFNLYVFLIGLGIFSLTSLSSISLFVDRYLLFLYVFSIIPIAYTIHVITKYKSGDVLLLVVLLFNPFILNNDIDFEHRLNIKKFLRTLKDNKFGEDGSKVLCLYEGYYPLKSLTNYSQMYYKRDVCDDHLRIENFDHSNVVPNYDYVIRYTNDDVTLAKMHAKYWTDINEVYSFRDFKVHKILKK